MQTLETAWASYWPDSSLGKVSLWKEKKDCLIFPFCHLTTHRSSLSSYFSSWLHHFCNLLMLCLSPTIWQFPPPSSFLSPIFPYLLLVLSFCVFHVLLPPSPALLPASSMLPSSPSILTPFSAPSVTVNLCFSFKPTLCDWETCWADWSKTGIETEQVSMSYFT